MMATNNWKDTLLKTEKKAPELVKAPKALLDEKAVRIAVKLLKRPDFEGCNLVAYPDPASPLYEALSVHGMLRKYMAGKLKHSDLPENFQALDGKPYTIGYGETQGVKCGDVWTQEQADERIEKRVREFMLGVLKACPQLQKENAEKIAACTSLAYNVGLSNFASSTVCKKTQARDYEAAADAFGMWIKAQGKVLQGLVNRRKVEADLYRSVGG
jgi:lysozyme